MDEQKPQSEVKLKPCPFCGEDGDLIETATMGGLYAAYCIGCGAQSRSGLDKVAAAAEWNDRVSEAAIRAESDAEIERLRAEILENLSWSQLDAVVNPVNADEYTVKLAAFETVIRAESEAEIARLKADLAKVRHDFWFACTYPSIEVKLNDDGPFLTIHGVSVDELAAMQDYASTVDFSENLPEGSTIAYCHTEYVGGEVGAKENYVLALDCTDVGLPPNGIPVGMSAKVEPATSSPKPMTVAEKLNELMARMDELRSESAALDKEFWRIKSVPESEWNPGALYESELTPSPSTADTALDERVEAKIEFTYLSDAEAMVSALKEAGARHD